MSPKTAAHSKVALWLFVLVLSTAIGPGAAMADSIWNSASKQPSSYYSSTKGEYKIGDIITILVVESFKASNKASTETDKERDLGAGFQGFDEFFGLTHFFGQPVASDPSFKVNSTSEFDGSGSSDRSSTVTGTVTGQITEILENGNLRLEASKTTVINGEKNSMILLGTIRPQDISSGNTVYSTQVSNAEIRYEGVGPLSTVQKRGVLTEFLEFIWPF